MAALLLLALSAPLAAFAQNDSDLNLAQWYGSTIYPDFSRCSAQPSFYSCENTTAITDTCCSPYPGGLLLLVELWDTYTGMEAQGQLLPEGEWTLHGLWPDNCDEIGRAHV